MTCEVREDSGQRLLAMGRQFNGLPCGVDDPAEDELPGSPAAISLAQLLKGDRFVAVLLVCSRLGQH